MNWTLHSARRPTIVGPAIQRRRWGRGGSVCHAGKFIKKILMYRQTGLYMCTVPFWLSMAATFHCVAHAFGLQFFPNKELNFLAGAVAAAVSSPAFILISFPCTLRSHHPCAAPPPPFHPSFAPLGELFGSRNTATRSCQF